MILARCWRVIKTKDKMLMIPSSLKMIPNFRYDSEHNFGFDTKNPLNWQLFLERYKVNGELLPRRTAEGHLVAYNVYDTKQIKVSLFPGFDKDGKKRLVALHGYLR